MKICMFTNTYLPHVGGVARSVSTFTEDLRRLGHDVLVVAPTFGDDDEPSERAGEILRVPAIQNFNGSDFSVQIPIPFIINNRITAFQPDIVHSHHPFLLGDAARRVASSHCVPLVFTHHTLYEKYTHYVPLNTPRLKRFVIQLATDYANLCDRVIAPSRSIGRLIKDRGVRTSIEEIPTGIDIESFRNGNGERFRKEYNIPKNHFVIGHLGRLAPEKNLSYLAKAVCAFLERDSGACFLIVGAGPGKEKIVRIFKRKKLENRLLLVGKKTGQELFDAYQAMDLFVFSSKTETQGLVLAEAMAAGTPVIALSASGTREVVKDGENGRLLKGKATIKDFIAAIEEGFENSEHYERWCRGAVKTADAFSRERSVRRLVALYEQTIAAHEKDTVCEVTSWDRLLTRLKTEWDMLSQKVSAAAEAIGNRE